jgi:hypothetical protein
VSRRNVIPLNRTERHANVDPIERALLPWEDRETFLTLRKAYHRHHAPEGPTETGLVDQLVWLDWRRQRLVIGERSAHMAALQDRLSAEFKTADTIRRAMIESGDKGAKDELATALSSPSSGDAPALADTDADEAMTRRAISILETGDPAAYSEALGALREDTACWWEDIVGDDEQTHPDGQQQEGDSYKPYARNATQLLRFLKDETMQNHRSTRGELLRRPAIRLQAQGESIDPFRMNLLLTLDERLARLFEKTLAMLLKLQELRLSRDPPPCAI